MPAPASACASCSASRVRDPCFPLPSALPHVGTERARLPCHLEGGGGGGGARPSAAVLSVPRFSLCLHACPPAWSCWPVRVLLSGCARAVGLSEARQRVALVAAAGRGAGVGQARPPRAPACGRRPVTLTHHAGIPETCGAPRLCCRVRGAAVRVCGAEPRRRRGCAESAGPAAQPAPAVTAAGSGCAPGPPRAPSSKQQLRHTAGVRLPASLVHLPSPLALCMLPALLHCHC